MEKLCSAKRKKKKSEVESANAAPRIGRRHCGKEKKNIVVLQPPVGLIILTRKASSAGGVRVGGEITEKVAWSGRG